MAPNADIAEKDHLWMGTTYSSDQTSDSSIDDYYL